MDNYHELYTTDSNTIIKLEELSTNIDNLNLKEQNHILESVIEESNIINNEYKKEIAKLKLIEAKRKVEITKDKLISINNQKSNKEKNYINNLFEKYEDEIKIIIKLTSDELIERLDKKVEEDILTKEYIIFLMLGIGREIKYYEEMFFNDMNNNDLDFLTEIKNEIKSLETKKEILMSYKNINVNSNEENNNKILFFETFSKRAYFIEDVEGNLEFYNSFSKLLDSIKKGNPKKLKLFTNNVNLNGLMEARDPYGKTRIFFDYIGNNTYIIINAIIKKEDKSSGYKNQLDNRYSLYLQEKNNILLNLNNPEFILRQEKYLEYVNNLFNKNIQKLELKIGDKDA